MMDKQTPFRGTFTGLPVLVTGHTGFKGSWLSIWLAELGARVIGYSRDSGINPRNLELCHLRSRITHVRGDISDCKSLKRTIETHQPQLVIHMAAQSLVKESYQEPKRTFDTNVGGTVNVLEAIRKTQSVRAFIGVTADKVYENQEWVWGYRENDRLGGHDPYSASKAIAELAIGSYRRSWGESGFADHPVAIASTRGGNVIGGGDFAKDGLVPDCIRALMQGVPVKVGSPQSVRPWQHVLELLSGYLWLAVHLLQEPASFSEAWNFGPQEQESVTCETIAKELIRLWGASSDSYQAAQASPNQPHETLVLRLNWTKAAVRLRWRPTYNWHEGLTKIVDWFKEYDRQEKQRAAGGPAVDMYPLCIAQIDEYVQRARTLGIEWALPLHQANQNVPSLA